MILKKCYVYAFGKIKDFTYDFSDGFNQINEKNGWGKTTLATFIKCIFYGIDSGKKGLKGSERKKYKPWRSLVKFGGYVVFLWQNKPYKIERYFGDKESDDTVKLFDESTGKELSKTEDLGKRIFSIDEEGFLSSVYFSQKDLEGDVSNGLIEKFNSSYSKDNDRFDKAIERVDSAIKDYKIRGDKGKIADLKREIADIEQQLDKSIRAAKTYVETEKLYKTATNDCAAYKTKIDELSSELERAANAAAVREKNNRIKENSDRIARLKINLAAKREIIKNKPDLSIADIDYYYNVYKDLTAQKEKLSVLKETLSGMEKINAEKPTKNSSPIFAVSAVLSIVLLVAASVFFVLNSAIIGVFALIFSLLSAVFCIYTLIKEKKNDKITTIPEQLIKQKNAIIDCEKNIKQKTEQLDFFLGLFSFDSVFGEDSKFTFLRSVVSDASRLENEIRDEEQKLNELLKEVGLAAFNSVTAENSEKSVSEIQAELSILREKLAVAEHDRAEKGSQLKMLDEYASIKGDIENSLSDTKALLSEAEEEYKILCYTKEYLLKSNDDIIAKYREPLETSFKKYLSLIDEENAYSGNIDVNLNLSIVDDGANNSTLYYSQGYRDLFEICKRFSFIDVLFTGEKPFIILDDPFCNLDKDKLKTALQFIKELSKEYQIIYFICHDSRSV